MSVPLIIHNQKRPAYIGYLICLGVGLENPPAVHNSSYLPKWQWLVCMASRSAGPWILDSISHKPTSRKKACISMILEEVRFQSVTHIHGLAMAAIGVWRDGLYRLELPFASLDHAIHLQHSYLYLYMAT